MRFRPDLGLIPSVSEAEGSQRAIQAGPRPEGCVLCKRRPNAIFFRTISAFDQILRGLLQAGPRPDPSGLCLSGRLKPWLRPDLGLIPAVSEDEGSRRAIQAGPRPDPFGLSGRGKPKCDSGRAPAQGMRFMETPAKRNLFPNNLRLRPDSQRAPSGRAPA